MLCECILFIFAELQNRVEVALSVRKLSLLETLGYLCLLSPIYDVIGAAVLFVTKEPHSRIRPTVEVTQIAALSSAVWERTLSHYIMNVGVILNVLKAVVSCHPLDLQRLWGQRLLAHRSIVFLLRQMLLGEDLL